MSDNLSLILLPVGFMLALLCALLLFARGRRPLSIKLSGLGIKLDIQSVRPPNCPHKGTGDCPHQP